MESGSTSIYFNKTDLNGQNRRHRHAPDFHGRVVEVHDLG